MITLDMFKDAAISIEVKGLKEVGDRIVQAISGLKSPHLTTKEDFGVLMQLPAAERVLLAQELCEGTSSKVTPR